MIISHSRRFTFIHISKAGGTSIETGLEPYLAWNDLYLGNPAFGQQAHDAYQNRFALHKHSSVAEIERLCGAEYVDSFYLFALVRHPADRLCSLYNFVGTTVLGWARSQNIHPKNLAERVDEKTIAAYPFLDWAASKVFMTTRTFSEFIRHDSLRWDVAFESQVSRLTGMHGGPPKGHIFRLEDSASWLPVLHKALGLEFSLGHENQSGLQLVQVNELPPADRSHIESLFADDYAAFGY